MKGDIEQCLLRTRSFFSSIPYDLENNQEKHYQTIFYLLFRLMGQYVDVEVKNAIGRADVVIKMSDAIYVFEFKVDGTPEEALAQINSKQYAIPYEIDHHKVVKVGVNFDSTTRTLGKWVIEYSQQKEFEAQSQLYPEYYILKVNDFNQVAKSPLEEWIYYLNTGDIPDSATAPGLTEVRERLRLDKMTKAELEAYYRHLDNIVILKDNVFTERAEGREEGRLEEKRETASNMKS